VEDLIFKSTLNMKHAPVMKAEDDQEEEAWDAFAGATTTNQEE